MRRIKVKTIRSNRKHLNSWKCYYGITYWSGTLPYSAQCVFHL